MRLLALTALFIATGGLASADRMTLKNGNVVRGTYLGGTARQVRFDANGGVQTYDIDQVRSISFSDDEDQSNAQPNYPDRNNYPPPPQQSQGGQPQSAGQYPQRQYSQNDQPRNDSARNDQPRNQNNQGAQLGITLPADTPITVRMIDAVNSQTTRIGQTFRASVDEPVMVADRQVIPRGADVITKLVDDQKSGRIQGRTVLTLALVSVSVNGQMVDVTSLDVRTASASRAGKSAGLIGGGAAVGAIVGAIAGGGKGAAIGAASGGALGGATTVLTNGQEVKIPSETRLTFRLQYPVQI
jgi:hypothetical protein